MDIEAIAWAYRKCINFGIENNTMENALMMDRLKQMLEQQPEPSAAEQRAEMRRQEFDAEMRSDAFGDKF